MTHEEVRRLEAIWYELYQRINKLERSGVEERYIEREDCNAAWRVYKDALEVWTRYKQAVEGSRMMRHE
jgi:hypothetical protein